VSKNWKPIGTAPGHRVVIVEDGSCEDGEREAIHNGRAWHPHPILDSPPLDPQPTKWRG
jgi:hypothetical protein